MTRMASARWTLVWFVASFFIGICLVSISAKAQAGNNAVCTGIMQCGTPSASPAFIDASVLQGNNDDFCKTIFNVIGALNYPATGEVIDARGISARLTCASGTSPWFNGANYANKPSTILLPAGTITIPATWVLPAGTKLIGEGSQDPPNSIPIPLPGATVIQACTSSLPRLQQRQLFRRHDRIWSCLSRRPVHGHGQRSLS